MHYINNASESVVGNERLLGASELIGGIDPTYIPGYSPAIRRDLTLGLNVLSIGLGLHQIGSMIAAVTVVGQFFDEINKFLWWLLHLSSYLLVLVPVPLFIGLAILRGQAIDIHLGPAWVPAVLAGVVAMVMTFRTHRRLDTYSGV